MLTFFKKSKLLTRLLRYPPFYYEDNQSCLARQVQSEWNEYELWLTRNRLFTVSGLKALHQQVRQMKIKPKVSIIMPVFNPVPFEIKQAIESVQWQAYPCWELCLVDDFSGNREYLSLLKGHRDRRVKVHLRDSHGGIAETVQYALERAAGDYVAFLDQDDVISPDALYSFIFALQSRKIDYFYSDRDMISPQGRRYMHFFKPDWSPEYLLSFNYTVQFEVFSKQLVLESGGVRKDFEGSQDYDLALRVTERTSNVYHHPMVLYSWRQSPKSIAADHSAKSYVFLSGVKAVLDAVRRRNLPVKDVIEIPDLWRGHYRIIWDGPSLLDTRVTFILLSNSPEEDQRLKVILKECAGRFAGHEFRDADYSSGSVNAQLRNIHHDGYVVFCDSSVKEIVSEGLVDMLGYLNIDGVEASGAKFVNGDNVIDNVGMAVASSGKVLKCYRGAGFNEAGYGAVAAVPRNVSLVSPSFWACSARTLRERGFLSGSNTYYSSALGFFKNIIGTGRRIVCVPYMCLRVSEEAAGSEEALRDFSMQWMKEGMQDIYYNPNLTDINEDFGIKI